MHTARSFGPAAVTGFPYSKHWVVSGYFRENCCALSDEDPLYSIGSGRSWALFSAQDSIHSSNSESQTDYCAGDRAYYLFFPLSYRYWKLNPDQATIDTRKSPGDPIVAAKTIVRSNKSPSLDGNEKRRDNEYPDENAAGTSENGGIEQKLNVGQRGRQMNDSPV